jgi:hypothetical protein
MGKDNSPTRTSRAVHIREVIPGDGAQLKETRKEIRGQETFVLRQYTDPAITLAEAWLNQRDAFADYEVLLLEADKLLADELGEVGYYEACEIAAQAEMQEDASTDSFQISLALWAGEICQRHGQLSPAGAAAIFCVQGTLLCKSLGPAASETLVAVMAFAKSWHRHYREVSGEYPAALAHAHNRAKGPDANAARKARRREIVEEECQRIWAALESQGVTSRRSNAKATALEIIDSVQQRFIEEKMKETTIGSLEALVRDVIGPQRRRNSAKN